MTSDDGPAKRQRDDGGDAQDGGASGGEGAAAAATADPPAAGGPQDDEEDDDMVGPLPPPAAKKRKVLEFEQVYLKALPSAEMYERSYMHRDTVTHVAVAQATEFFITGSVDGHIKFWKKQKEGVEFAKHFKAHLGPVTGLAVSTDGTLAASISSDKSVKVFDVASFDMVAMLRLTFVPSCAEWIFKKGDAKPKLAIADAGSAAVRVYDMHSGSNDPLETLQGLHGAPVMSMRYNAPKDVVISGDSRGMLEYWSASDYKPPSRASSGPGGATAPVVSFAMKMDTDLYALAKAKAQPRSIEVSADGTQFSVFCSDWRVRVFAFATGRLRRSYDESADAAAELQRAESEMFKLDPIDFGRRLAVEKEVHADEEAPWPNAVFDESGNFLMYATLFGIKVVNLVTNRVSRLLGKVENTERFLRLALFQGAGATGASAGLGRRPKLQLHDDAKGGELRDPTLLCCAFQRQRLYLFTQREPVEADDAATGRDIFNERPSGAEMALEDAEGGRGPGAALPRGAVIHTTLGDITVKLFPDECPKTVENFTTHAKSGYYDNIIFHRIIRGFMLQTGDPEGDGTGGESIWGGEFEDEFSRNLRHDRPFTVSMANAGPNTNGSQFFITTVPTPWLDGKHTVFGRVVKGSDVVLALERVKVTRHDKPVEDVKMLNIEVKQSVD